MPSTSATDADKKKFDDAKKLAEQKANEQNTQNLKNGAAATNAQKTGTHTNPSNVTTANVVAGVKASGIVDSTSISPKDGNTPVTINTGAGTATPGAPQISDAYIHRSDVSVDQLADVILHEADHYALSKAVDSIKDPSSKVLEGLQHQIISPKGGRGQKYCADTGSCGSCSPLSSLFNALKKCGIAPPESGPPPVSPLARLIYPLEPPGSSNAWTTCFAGLLPTGLGGVPATCAALMCPPDASVAVSQTTCSCGSSGGARPFRSTRCGALDCVDGLPVIGPSGLCSCARGNFETVPNF
jgi:hypothetical protein